MTVCNSAIQSASIAKNFGFQSERAEIDKYTAEPNRVSRQEAVTGRAAIIYILTLRRFFNGKDIIYESRRSCKSP